MKSPPRTRRARVLWIVGAVFLAYSVLLAVTDGLDFTVLGVRIRSRTWQRPGLIGLVCVTIAAIAHTRRAAYVSRRTRARAERAWVLVRGTVSARGLALAAAGWTAIAGLAFGTFIAGGADSSGYLNQVTLLSQGRLLDQPRFTEPLGWPDRALKLAPLGYRPTPDRVRLAPTYPPGYPLLMTPAFLLHERAVHLVVPLCGVLAVWLTYLLGRRLGEPAVGASAAVLVSISPTFLYQLVQPMSDIPVTAAWLLALYLAARGTIGTAILSGLVTGIAILIRPNLMPLAVIVWAVCGIEHRSSGRRGWPAVAAALATVPGVVTLGVIQAIRYGSPLGSGYGPARDLFAWANVVPNLERYPRWLFETHTPLIALFLLTPVWLARRRTASRSLLLILWTFSVAVVAAYLPYVYFQPQEWMYTRFLLPAIPIMWLLSLIPIADLLRRMRPVATVIAMTAFLGLCVFSINEAKARFAFELKDGERKYLYAGDYVQRTLPSNAVIISMQHSGSVWFYADRPIVRWDHVEPENLDLIIRWLKDHGYAPYFVVDKEEFVRIQQRFTASGQRWLNGVIPLTEYGDVRIYAIP